jgi:hypothetical protein
LFPNKDINNDFEVGNNDQKSIQNIPAAQVNSILEERTDVILKLKNDPNYACEKQILQERLNFFKSKYIQK